MIIGCLGFAIGEWLHSPILFDSKESKTKDFSTVYNRVSFTPGWSEDVWVMQQSHQGLDHQFKTWDRLMIRVDKTQKPIQAFFYQLKPDQITKPLEKIDHREFKVSCYTCHPSGPRAIRVDNQYMQSLGLFERIKIFILNTRIKLYFAGIPKPGYPKIGSTPFKMEFEGINQSLNRKSCESCHKEGGVRQPLQAHHWATAKHLVETGAMPPWPHTIHEEDKKFFQQF